MAGEHVLTASEIGKKYGDRTIFSGLTFSLEAGKTLGITGRNGSGKSTLVKILAGVLSSSLGAVTLSVHGKPVPAELRFRHVGFVAPYLQLYDEFTGSENLEFANRIRGTGLSAEELQRLLRLVNLESRKGDFVRTYSSGMKQRLKYAFALLHKPPVLILDEPMSNLDSEGVEIVGNIIRDQRERGMVVIATNDRGDLKYCDASISVESTEAGSRSGDAG